MLLVILKSLISGAGLKACRREGGRAEWQVEEVGSLHNTAWQVEVGGLHNTAPATRRKALLNTLMLGGWHGGREREEGC